MSFGKISENIGRFKSFFFRKRTIKCHFQYRFNYLPLEDDFKHSSINKLKRFIKNKTEYYKILQERARELNINSTIELDVDIGQTYLNVDIHINKNFKKESHQNKKWELISIPDINKNLTKVLLFKEEDGYNTQSMSFSYKFNRECSNIENLKTFEKKYIEFLNNIVINYKLCNLLFISNPVIKGLKDQTGFEKLNEFYTNINRVKKACVESGVAEKSIIYQVISNSFIFITKDDFFWAPLSIDFELHKKMFSSDDIGIEFISKVFLSRIYKNLDTSGLTEENYKEYFALGKMMSY